MKAFVLFFLSCSGLLWAQELTFSLAPENPTTRDRIYFVVRVENASPGRGLTFVDDFNTGDDFSLLQRTPNRSSQLVFGSNNRNMVTTFQYHLRANRAGQLSFPPQKIKLNDQIFTSPTLTIEVLEARQPQTKAQPNRPAPQGGRSGSAWLQWQASNDKPYVGEPIELGLVLYRPFGSRIDLSVIKAELPKFQGVWSEDLDSNFYQPERTRVDGEFYEYSPVRSWLLFPNQAGKLSIGEAHLGTETVFREYRRQLSAEALELDVQPLPTAGRPDTFSGLVGQFDLSSTVDKDTAKTGESISVTIRLDGLGNLPVITDMEPTFETGHFELFEGGAPEILRAEGAPRRKIWRYAVIPKATGALNLTMPSFSYFDHKEKTYKTIEGDVITIDVSEGETLVGGNTATEQSRIEAVQNLAFIKLDALGTLDQRTQSGNPMRLVWLAALLIAVNLLVLAGLLIRNRGQSRRAELRPRFAFRNYKKAAAKLNVKSEDGEAFYAALSRAVFDYFGDKWERPGQGISLDVIQDQFDRKSLGDGLFQQVAEVVESIDLARFTPSTSSSRDSLLKKTNDMVAAVEEVL